MQTAPARHAHRGRTIPTSGGTDGMFLSSEASRTPIRKASQRSSSHHTWAPPSVSSLSGYGREGTTGLSDSLAGFFVAKTQTPALQTHGDWTRASEPSDGVSFLRAQILGARVERRPGQVRPGGPSCNRKIPVVPHSQIPVLAPGGVKFVNPPEASGCGSVPQRKDGRDKN